MTIATLRQSNARRFLLAFGVWFTFLNYVAGTLVWPATITDPNAMHMIHLLGFIPVMVNGWHLYFHLVTGLVCLACAASGRGIAQGALVVGTIYVVTGSVGLVVPGYVFGLICADTFGNLVHIAEGVGLLATAFGARFGRHSNSSMSDH